MANKTITYRLDLDVHNSMKSMEDLEIELQSFRDELKTVSIGSNRFKELQQEIIKVDSKLKNVNKSVEGMDFEQVSGEIGKLAGGVGAVTAAFTLMGGEGNETMEELQQKLNQGMAIFMGVKGAIEGITAVTKLWRVAQVALNAAMTANPLGVIIAGVAALAAGVYLLIRALEKQDKAQQAVNEANKAAYEAYDEQAVSLRILQNTLEEGNTTLEERKTMVDTLNTKYGDLLDKELDYTASEEELAKAMEKVDQQLIKRLKIEAYTDQLRELIKENIEFSRAQENVEKALDGVNKQGSDFQKWLLKLGDSMGVGIEDLTSYENKLKDNERAIKRLTNEINNLDGGLEDMVEDEGDDLDDSKRQWEQYIKDRRTFLLELELMGKDTFEKQFIELERWYQEQLDLAKKFNTEIISIDEEYKKRYNDLVDEQEEYKLQQKKLANEKDKQFEEKWLKDQLTTAKRMNAKLYSTEEEIRAANLTAEIEYTQSLIDLNNEYRNIELYNQYEIDIANNELLAKKEDLTQKLDELNKKQIKSDKELAQEREDLRQKEIDAIQAEADAKVQILDATTNMIRAFGQENTAFAKTVALTSIAIDTASAIASAVAATAGSSMTVVDYLIKLAPYIAAILTNVGEAYTIINSTPMAEGGLITGPSHAMGGVKMGNYELEGGEYIIRKDITDRYLPELERINNGYPLIDYDLLAKKINEKKVYVVSKDMTRQQGIDTKVRSRAILK